MKKIYFLLITLLYSTMMAFAYDAQIDGIYYNFDYENNTAIVTSGDNKYFGGEKREKYSSISDKLHLHSYKIDLSALYNKKCIIKAPLPEYFIHDLENIGIIFKG